MSEHLRRNDDYERRRAGLRALVTEYLGAEDAEFIDEMEDETERVSYVYGLLIGFGEDPDEVLQKFGVTVRSDDHEI